MNLTEKDRQDYKTARRMSSQVIAMAAIDQAENFLLSEATALELAASYGTAAQIARERRLAAAGIKDMPPSALLSFLPIEEHEGSVRPQLEA